MSGHRNWHEIRRQQTSLWAARCGDPSVDDADRVEVTGYWANGERIHSSHLVRVAGVRSFGCVHARPWLGWRWRADKNDWLNVCHIEDCPAGGDPDGPTNAAPSS